MIEWSAGLAGGCAGVIVGHPFDTVKVKLQTQDYRNPKYKGTWDCFSQTIKKDGARGLYRGMASPMMGVGAVNAVIFGVQSSVAKKFKDQNALSTHFASGVCAGVTQAFICSPVELTKTRLQIQADMLASGGGKTAVQYKGPLDCFQQIYKKDGIRGIFRGQLITIMREIPAFGTYFLTYEVAARTFSGQGSSDSAGAGSVLMAGGTAGTASWVVSYPLDVIKTRIQSDGAFGPARYNGIIDCFVKSIREEGLGVLTRGLNSTVLRAFPTNAATFFVVTSVMKHFRQPDSDTDNNTLNNKSRTLSEICRTGDIIVQAASIANEIQRYQQTALRKIKENHLANYLPAVLANTKESLICITEHKQLLSDSQVSCMDPNARQSLDAILYCPVQKASLDESASRLSWVSRRGIVTQRSLDARKALTNQQILSLVL